MPELSPVPDVYKSSGVGVVAPNAAITQGGGGNPYGILNPSRVERAIPYILAQNGIFIVPSSGSSNATGLISGLTALPSLYGSNPAWVWLPAGVVVGDLTGNWYQGVVQAGQTSIQLVGYPATANAAYTQTTGAYIALPSVAVPGGAMGPNGILNYGYLANASNDTANAKTLVTTLGGTSISTTVITTSFNVQSKGQLKNVGAQNCNATPNTGGAPTWVASNGSNVAITSIDTSQAQSLVLQVKLAVATSFLVVVGWDVEIQPS